jgi:RecB family endonuclease NucS
MPIKHTIWKVGAAPSPLAATTLLNEQQLEEMIVSIPQILSGDWMLIGRQERTCLGGRIDLLAVNGRATTR